MRWPEAGQTVRPIPVAPHHRHGDNGLRPIIEGRCRAAGGTTRTTAVVL